MATDATLKFNVDFSQIISSVKNLESLLGKINVGEGVGKKLEGQLKVLSDKLAELSKVKLSPDMEPAALKEYNNTILQIKKEATQIARAFGQVNNQLKLGTGLTKDHLNKVMNVKVINEGIQSNYEQRRQSLEQQIAAIKEANQGMIIQKGLVESVSGKVSETTKEKTKAKLEENQAYKDLIKLEKELEALNKNYKEKDVTRMEELEELAAMKKEEIRDIEATALAQEDLKNTTDNLVNSSKEVTGELEEQGKTGKRNADALTASVEKVSERMKKLAEFTIAAFALRQLREFVTSGLRFIQDLDKSLTEIATVTGKTREEMWGMADDFNKMGRELGKTTNEIAQASVIFYRQGLNSSQVMEMVRASTISASIANTNAAEASNRLTAALRGYNMEADQAMVVADKLAALAAKSASSFDELSYAMTKTAASAAVAGIDMDHLYALVA